MAHVEQKSAVQTNQPVLSVSQLTLFLKELVEAAFPSVWVAGEISNFSRPQSGHCYLTLKDDQAQIKAVIWRTAASRLRFEPHDGLEVICRGHIDLYPPRGQYQLVIEEIQPRGIGALELALRKLREKLAAEGLFDPARKAAAAGVSAANRLRDQPHRRGRARLSAGARAALAGSRAC